MRSNTFEHRTTAIFLTLFISFTLMAQAPGGFSYQAVARADNDVLANTTLDIEISIIQGSPTNSPVYTEVHEPVTNEYGLFTLVAGEGTPTLSLFSEIDWSLGDYYFSVKYKRSTDTGFFPASVMKLQSVPYALFAESTSDFTSLEIKAGEPGTGEPLFQVLRSDGYPVFAVYEEGVYAYTDMSEDGKGFKGGFAVGGYNAASKSLGAEQMRITADSIRFYINDSDDGKGIKGGFAVGGYNAKKLATREFLRVTDDSTRIYVDQVQEKGLKGGFAVGGYNAAGKSGLNDFLNLTPENYFIGHQSGSSITTGLYNSFIGYNSGSATTEGNHNVFIGKDAGAENVVGGYNVILGSGAGRKNNGFYNVFIGYESGLNNVSGGDSRFSKYNTYVGYQSGRGNTTGWNNLAIGFQAGLNNQTSTNQFFIGNGAGMSLTGGSNNTFIGHLSGVYSEVTSENTFVGYQTGYNNISGSGNTYVGSAAGLDATGSGNVFIGNRVGWSETGSNELHIDNYDNPNPLIHGDFTTNFVTVNGWLGIGTPPTSPLTIDELPETAGGGLEVRYFNGGLYTSSSSAKTKENIVALTDDFRKILQAEPVSFTDKASGERHIGFIAEDFEELGLENLVIYVDGEPASLSYELISIYNLEIIKEQSRLIGEKDQQIEELQERLEKVEKYLFQMGMK